MIAPTTAIAGPLSLGDLLDRAFRLYRARFGILAATAALLYGPVGLISTLITGRAMVRYSDFLEGFTTSPGGFPGEAFNSFLAFGGAIMLVAVLGMLATGLVALAATSHCIALLHGRTLTLRQGVHAGFSRLLTFLGMNIARWAAILLVTMAIAIVVGAVVAVAAGVVGGAAFLINDDSFGTVGAIGLVVLLMCGYFALIIALAAPALYFSARWLVATPSLVDEGLGPVQSLRRSWALTRRNVWRSFGYTLLLSLLSILLITVPISVVQQILPLLVPIPDQVVAAASSALSSILSVLWQPLYAACLLLLYYDLRIRHESYDLALRIEQLEAEAGSGTAA